MKSKKGLLSTKHSLLRHILFGAISGFVAGIIMTPFLMSIGVIMGVDPNTISIARGRAFGFNNDNNNALIVGLVVHLLTSTVIGIIFAILVTKVSRFEITGYKKGLIEGIILGIAVFAILYIPTTLVMIQPQLHILISQNNPSLSQTQTQILGENMLVTGLGFLAHIVYGVVLGSMTTFLLRRRGSS
jgi:membrane protein CcdC involved in cytochrome C biogenesis